MNFGLTKWIGDLPYIELVVTVASIFSFLYSFYTIISNALNKRRKPRIRLLEYFTRPDVTYFYTAIENISTEPVLISSISILQGKNRTVCELKPVRVETIEKRRNGVVIAVENKMSLDFPVTLGHNQCISGYVVFYGCQEIDPVQTKHLNFQVQTNHRRSLSVRSSFEGCRSIK